MIASMAFIFSWLLEFLYNHLQPPNAIIDRGVIRFTEGQLQWLKTEKQPFFQFC